MKGEIRKKKNTRAPKELKESTAQFLDSALTNTCGFAQHLDSQTHILVGVSSLIFIFSVSRFLDQGGQLPFMILSIFSGFSALVGLFAIHPPAFMRKRGQEESLMFHKHIVEFPTASDYVRELTKVVEDRDVMIREYATTIYNVSKYYYRPKRRLFHYARNILLVGIFLGLIAFIADLFYAGM